MTDKCEHDKLEPTEIIEGELRRTEFHCVECGHMIGYWQEDEDKIYIEFEKRGDMFSVVPTFDPVEMKDMKDINGRNIDIDHDLSEEDKEDLKLALKLGVDWIALSFVEHDNNVSFLLSSIFSSM